MNTYRWICSVLLVFLPHAVPALGDASAQRGAIWYMNYCAGCHSVRYVSWDRVTKDLALSPHQDMMPNIHVRLSVPDLSKNWQDIGLHETDARVWFGKMPPDLSTLYRLRGQRWLQGYLTGFYADPDRPFGVSNHRIANVMMPNVLAPLQQQLTPLEFADMINDIVNFLAYVSDPSQSIRRRIGLVVVIFLALGCGLLSMTRYRRKS